MFDICKMKYSKMVTHFILAFSFCFQNSVKSQALLPSSEGGNTTENLSFNLIKAQGGGTFSGDVQLSLPLITVPGRNGLNYTINLNYSSGIRTIQKAAWVGLGFNLQIGSITRNVINRIDDQLPTMFGSPTNFNIDAIYGSVGNPEDEGSGLLWNDPSFEVWDDYYLNFPAGSQRIVPIIDANNITTFYAEEWRPWIIGYNFRNDIINNNNNLGDFSDFIPNFLVITDDGTKYYFEHRTFLTVTNGQPPPPISIKYIKFPISWDLTAIYSADYVNKNGNVDIYGNPIPDDEDEGSWVKITYTTPVSVDHGDQHAVSLGANLSFGQGGSADAQLNYDYGYVSTIETPSHKAVFETSLRDDYTGRNGQKPSKLDRIKLVRKVTSDGSPGEEEISRIEFIYASLANDFDTNWEDNEKLKDHCLTLIQVQEMSGGISKPPYKFKYGLNPDGYKDTPKDRFGYKLNDGTAWCLKEITHPEGGTVEYVYESDRFNWGYNVDGNDPASVPNFKTYYDAQAYFEGGPRLLKKIVKDGMGNSYEYNYTYGDGVNNLLNTVDVDWNFSQPVAFEQFVGYRWVQETLPPGNVGYVKTHFTSGVDSNPANVYVISGTLPSVNAEEAQPDTYNGTHLFSNSVKRGIIWKQEFYNSGNVIVKQIDNNYSFTDKYVWMQQSSIQEWHQLANKIIWAANQSEQIIQDGVTSMTEFLLYNTTNGLPKTIRETNSNGQIRTKTITYAHEVPAYQTAGGSSANGMQSGLKNMLSQEYMNVIYDGVEAPGNARSAIKTTWKVVSVFYNSKNYYKWYLDKIYNWREDGPSYNFTGDTDPEFIQMSEATRYDAFGNVIGSKDANGVPTTTIWGYKSSFPVAQFRNALFPLTGNLNAAAYIFDDNYSTTTGQTYAHHGRIADDWTGVSTGWSITSGVYRQTNGTTDAWTNNHRRCNKVALDDGVFEADIRFDDSNYPRYAGISKYVSTDNFVRFELRRTSATDQKVRIHAQKGAGLSVTLEAAKSLSGLTWYHVRGEIQGSIAKLYVDGELLVTLNDSKVDHGNGNIGLCTSATIARFDNVRIYPLNVLATSTTYDAGVVKANAQMDESGISTLSTYDGFGRLTNVKDGPGNLLRDVIYFYSSPFSSSNPNHIQTKAYRSGTDFTTRRSYFDGLGRKIQMQENEGTGSNKTATIYDLTGRVQKIIKSFVSSSQTYATAPVSDAISYYASNHPAYYSGSMSQEFDVGNYPFSETVYFADPLNRVNKQGAPGTTFRIGATPEKVVTFQYLSNVTSDVTGYAANTLYKQRRTDENGNLVDTFTDKFGNTVATTVDPGGALNYKTVFSYDVLGNLKQVVDPKQLTTTYSYNTLNQLRQKVTPDAGTTEYLYDKNGNLRFVKDAKGAAATTPYFIYYKYDSFNRKIEEGTMPIGTNFTQANADNASFPTTGQTFKIKYHYDFAGYAPGIPQKNLPGRMDAIEYVSERFNQPNQLKGYIFYSYDERGNLDWVEQYIPRSSVSDGNGYLSTRIEYDYDRQRNVTKVYFHQTFPPGASSNAFYVWYDYDELGRLKKVFSNTVDVKPGTADAEYTYWPSGQARRLVLGGTAQGVDYLYNSREWLTQINHQNIHFNPSQDPGGDGAGTGVPNPDRFGQIIGYNKQDHIAWNHSDFVPQFNGNISWTIHQTQHNTNPLGLSGWVFKYDKANRLIKGNWGFYTSQWSAPTDLKYDVVGPGTHPNNLITYDANGNIDYMIRYNENGAATNMDYVYIANTNKLSNITYSGVTSGTYSYTYDNNGSVIGDAKKLGTGSITYDDYRYLPKRVVKNNAPTGTIDYDYDGNGQRISKNDIFYVPGADGKVMAVYKIDGTHLYWNIWGLDLIGQRFYDPDNLQ